MSKTKLSQIKHSFFNNAPKKINFSFKDEEFSLDQFKKEFFLLYEVSLANKAYWLKDNEAVFYLLYLCDLLILYYQNDYVNYDLRRLKQCRKEIEEFFHQDEIKKQKILHKFQDFIFAEFKKNLQYYLSIFTNVSEFRKCVGTLNANRSRFTYSRGLAKHLITYLEKTSFATFIQEINHLIGNPYSFAESMDFLTKSSKVITDLGIVLFASRFILHFILLMKHVIESATKKELSVKKVLQQELEKRGFVMTSDLVWATVGLLTTYHNFFHIAQALVPPILITFLIFDSLLLLAQWVFEAKQYNQRLRELQAQQKSALFLEEAIIQRQMDLLNDEWEAQCSYFVINIFAANIIATCFAISILCTGPIALAGLAFFSLLGNAMYNASEEYKSYQKAKLVLKRELANGEVHNDAHHQQLLRVLQEECAQNHRQFWKTLAFNVGGIAFIITIAAASWPIAVGLTLAYMGYRLNHAYQNQLTATKEVPHDVYRILNSKETIGELPLTTHLSPNLCTV